MRKLLFLFLVLFAAAGCSDKEGVRVETLESYTPYSGLTEEGETTTDGKKGWWKYTDRRTGSASYRYHFSGSSMDEALSLGYHVVPLGLLLLLFSGGLIYSVKQDKYPVFYYSAVLLLPVAVCGYFTTFSGAISEGWNLHRTDLIHLFGWLLIALFAVLPLLSIVNFFLRKKTTLLVVTSILAILFCAAGIAIMYGISHLLEGRLFGAG